MSDVVVALVTVNDAGVYVGDEWPSDASRVLANPEWFSAPRAQTEPQPELVAVEEAAVVEPAPAVEPEPAGEPEVAPAE